MATNHTTRPKKRIRAFTLIEILICVAVLALLVAIAVPALNRSKIDSKNAQAEGTCKTLNDAITRVKLKHLGADGVTIVNLPPEMLDEDMNVVIQYLVDQGYIRE